MSSTDMNQSIITDYFNTISQRSLKQISSGKTRKNARRTLKFTDDKFESKLAENVLSTPKRSAKNVTSKTSTAKKRKLLEKNETFTDSKLIRRNEHPTGIGPVRKLDFDDCVQTNEEPSEFLKFVQSKKINHNNNIDNNNNFSVNKTNQPILNATEVIL